MGNFKKNMEAKAPYGVAPECAGEQIIDILQIINRYLAILNGRLEVMMQMDLSDYMKTDLTRMYEAENEISQLVRTLNIFCHTTLLDQGGLHEKGVVK